METSVIKEERALLEKANIPQNHPYYLGGEKEYRVMQKHFGIYWGDKDEK